MRVVRDGKRFHRDVAHVEAAPGAEEAEVQVRVQGAFDFILGGAIAINREAEFFRDADETGDVIAVFVGDEDGREIFRRPPDAREPLADLTRAEAAVHQHAGFIGFDVGSVAGGAAAEDREFDCHAGTLMSVRQRGNAIQSLLLMRFPE